MRRDERYTEKMKKAGFSKVCVWVPAEQAERVKQYAARLRQQEKRSSPT
jgi:hypothetical protein